jgi:hypothetical protein
MRQAARRQWPHSPTAGGENDIRLSNFFGSKSRIELTGIPVGGTILLGSIEMSRQFEPVIPPKR